MRRIDADRQESRGLDDRLQIGIEVLAIGAVRSKKALPETVERNIVIPWYHQRWCLELVDESASLLKLVRLGPLGQIS